MNKVVRELRRRIGENLWSILSKNKVMVAGGALVSAATQTKINDVDVYVRNRGQAFLLIEDLAGYYCVCCTERSAVFKHKEGPTVNLVFFDTFKSLKEIFGSFDYRCCMAGYDFGSKQFKCKKGFFHDNLCKELTYSGNSRYPIGALVRFQKYIKKGYTAGAPSILRLFGDLQKIDLGDHRVLEEQLGGMYGINISLKDKTLSQIIEEIENMERPLEAEFTRIAVDWEEVFDDAFFDRRCGKNVFCMINDHVISMRTANDEDMENLPDADESVIFVKWAKWVSEGQAESIHKKSFKYRVGELVSSGNPGIFVGRPGDEDKLTWSNRKGRCLVKIRAPLSDITHYGAGYGMQIRGGLVVGVGEQIGKPEKLPFNEPF